MPGNELKIIDFLLEEIGSARLPKIGILESISNPMNGRDRIRIRTSSEIKSGNARKKADVYLNDIGVSIKQDGSSFLYNRLQRADLAGLLRKLRVVDDASIVRVLDDLIRDYHRGKIQRNVDWKSVFSKEQFLVILRYLMMVGSPNYGPSDHPAELILTGPKSDLTLSQINLFTFDEFFEKFNPFIFITIRRQWLGQKSKSEHSRAKSLVSKEENLPWVFKDIVGHPRVGWLPDHDFTPSDRRTVYMVYLEVIH